ncbi:MAG: phosphoribosylanthranilate isomerase [Polyangiaceae bacterium]|nr:phosphoribosylanthranilate isomerase [Polyangiaceae bacterium]
MSAPGGAARPRVWVKICGVTTREDAERAVAAGADAVGVNLVEGSPRRITLERAREIAAAVGPRAETIAVVADVSVEAARAVLEATGASRVQLHGHEPPWVCAALGPAALQALRIGAPEDAERALAWPGELLIVDAMVPGALGGTGQRVAPELVRALARRRRVVLAGGLTPENVTGAVLEVAPWGVDVASGVERAGEPRRKDAARIAAFVRAARAASP